MPPRLKTACMGTPGPHTPTGEKGHPGRNLPRLLAISCKKTGFFFYIVQNRKLSYEHGHLDPPTNPLSTQKEPHSVPFNEQKKT